jgi:polyisoprenoid-binding protein YceI
VLSASQSRAAVSADRVTWSNYQLKKSANEFRRALNYALIALTAAFALNAFQPAIVNAATLRFKVDPDRSTVSAEVAEPLAVIRGNATGTFRIIDGAVSGDPTSISSTAKVRILIDAGSYRSDNPSRDRSVTEKSLEADKYPTIGFESNTIVGVVMTGPRECTAIVTGFLTLHGEAHATTMSVHATLDANGVFTGDGEIKLNYEDYGVKVPGVLFHAILAGDEATVRFHIVALNASRSAPGAPAVPPTTTPR